MRKSPLTNLTFTLSGRILETLVLLVFFGSAARALGRESFGIFLYAISVATLLASFSDLGTSNLIVREIAKNSKKGLILFSDIAGFRIILILAILTLTWLGGHFLFKSQEVLTSVFFLTLGYGLFWTADLFLDILRGSEEMHWVALFALLYKVLLAIVGLYAIWHGYGLNGLVAAYLISGGFFVCICAVFVKTIKRRIFFSFNYSSALNAVSESWPFAVPKVLGVLNIKLGLYFLSYFSTMEDVGIFGASLRLIEALLFIPWAISVASFPNLARLYNSSSENFENGVSALFKILMGIIIPTTLGTLFFSKRIILFVYGQNFLPAAFLLNIHIWVCFFYFATSLFAIYLQATYRQKFLALLGFVSLSMHALFALILTPQWGGTGAAVSALLSEFVLLLLCVRFYCKDFNFSNLLKGIWKILAAATGMMVVFWFFKEKSIFMVAIAGGISYIVFFAFIKPFSAVELTWLQENFSES